jgi:hypothetical protein
MSSSYLLNLKINQLQQEIQGIGEAVGYFWNMISTNGLTIDGGDTACNISAPAQNDTMWGHSDVLRNGTFQISGTSGATDYSTNMFFGISKDLSQNFPGASSPSMSMVNYGLIIDNQTQPGTYPISIGLILNGFISDLTTIGEIGSRYDRQFSMTYDGVALKFFQYINGMPVEIPALTQTVSLTDDYYLVAGSFFGGVLNKITWTGTVGGGPPPPPPPATPTLQQVLTAGNNAGGLSIFQANNVLANSFNISPAGQNVLDTVLNTPVFICEGRQTGFTSKPISSNPTSIMRFDLIQPNYGMFTMNIPAGLFSFQITAISPFTIATITASFWISNVLDDDISSLYPLNVELNIIQNLNQTLGSGGGVYTNTQPIILSRVNIQPSEYLYLNARLYCATPNVTANVSGTIFSYTLIAQPVSYADVTPSIVV